MVDQDVIDKLKSKHSSLFESGGEYTYSYGDDTDDESDPTHTCIHCDRTKHIESEPRSTSSWCDGAGSVTTWVPIGSARDT